MDLETLARRQRGILTRAQARTFLTEAAIRHRFDTGRWRIVHPGIYATHTADLDWYARAEASRLPTVIAVPCNWPSAKLTAACRVCSNIAR